MKKYFITFITAGSLFLSSCSSDEPKGGQEPVVPGEEYVQYTLTAEEIAAAEQLSDFNLNFFRSASATKQGENLVCSPVSASILLSMMANISDTELKEELLGVLGCDDMASLNSVAKKTLTELPVSDPATSLKFANGLWYHNEYTLNPAYEEIASEYFDTENFGMDFTIKQPVIDGVNAWVNERTNALIPHILKTLSDSVVAIQANAMYFKGAWANPFEVEETQKMPFYGSKGQSTVDMMHASGLQHHAESKDFTAIKMEFGKGALEAIFAMPKDEAVSIDDFIASDAMKAVCTCTYLDEAVDFSLPRFKYAPDDKLEIHDVLRDLGVSSLSTNINLFTVTESVDFTVYQKACVEFTEEGAEGAAVTWNFVAMAPDPEFVPTIPVANFNRPFVYIIRDAATGNMLFAGKITNL